jgi:polyhydroxyalkanoate synthesis regulator phasin
MSHMSAEERDKILEDLVRDSISELNDSITHEKVRLENHIDEEKTKFTQQLFNRFNQEVRQLKRCLKTRSYSDACTHYVTANWLNKELKDRGF